MKEHFGKQLKAAREARGYTQKELGKLVGIDAQNISQIELGNQYMRWGNFEKVAAALGESPQYFFSNERPATTGYIPSANQLEKLLDNALSVPEIREHIASVLAAYAEKSLRRQ